MNTRIISRTSLRVAVGLIAGLCVASVPSVALADGGGSTTTAPIKCKKGKIWDKDQKKCVDEAESSNLDQDSIFETGRALAYAGQYSNAIRVLKLAHDASDPRVLNMLGYSHRKSGQIEIAMGYYKAAIASDPDYSLVREYLGEAYLELGMLEAARGELSEIERICGGRTCDEYGKLAQLIIDKQL